MDLFIAAHKNEYGVEPEITASAPGRFHLIGEHSWFFKDKTLSMAVNLPVYVSISKRNDSLIKFYFLQMNERKKAFINSLRLKKEDKWANAVKAVIFGYIYMGYNLCGMEITIYSEILPSAGFGITTAIKIACAEALRTLFDLKCSNSKMLNAIDIANRIFLQQKNYKSDNFAAIFAKKGYLIITDHNKSKYNLLPFHFTDKKILLIDAAVPRIQVWNEETIFEPQNALLLGDLKETKNNVHGNWQYINDTADINEVLTVLGEDTKRKLLCIIREHFDVLEAVAGIEKNDFSRFARAVNRSHENLRDYYDLSCPEIEWLFKRITEIEPNLENIHNPVSCGRITGKGFGRCIYTFLRNGDADKFKQKLSEYEHIFGFKTSCYEVETADGVHTVETNKWNR